MSSRTSNSRRPDHLSPTAPRGTLHPAAGRALHRGSDFLQHQTAVTALRRCGRAHQHRAPRRGQPPSDLALRPTGNRLAAAATHRHAAVRVEQRAVAQRCSRSDSWHGGVRSRRTWHLPTGERRATKLSVTFAAAIYALNPNLLYLQTTAMNEPIFLAFFIWTLVYLDEFLRLFASDDHNVSSKSSPTGAGSLRHRLGRSSLHPLRRMVHRGHHPGDRDRGFRRLVEAVADIRQRRAMAKSLVEVLLLNALVPVFWLVHTNWFPAMRWTSSPAHTPPRPSLCAAAPCIIPAKAISSRRRCTS